MARKGTCSKCGVTFTTPHKQGPVPKTCTKCRPKKNRAAQAKRARDAGDTKSAEELSGAVSNIPEAALPSRMALGLSFYDHPEVAAAIMGIGGKPKDLEKLAELARLHHEDTIQLEASAVKQLGFQLIMLIFQKLRDSIVAGELTANLYGSTVKQIVSVLESIENTGAKLVPTETTVVWRREGGE